MYVLIYETKIIKNANIKLDFDKKVIICLEKKIKYDLFEVYLLFEHLTI